MAARWNKENILPLSLNGMYKPVFKRRRKPKPIQADLRPKVLPNRILDELQEKYRVLKEKVPTLNGFPISSYPVNHSVSYEEVSCASNSSFRPFTSSTPVNPTTQKFHTKSASNNMIFEDSLGRPDYTQIPDFLDQDMLPSNSGMNKIPSFFKCNISSEDFFSKNNNGGHSSGFYLKDDYISNTPCQSTISVFRKEITISHQIQKLFNSAGSESTVERVVLNSYNCQNFNCVMLLSPDMT